MGEFTMERSESLADLCDCMWVSFDPRERSICGLATVVGARRAVVGGA